MRFIIILLFLGCFLVIISNSFKLRPTESGPGPRARQFISHVKEGNYEKCVGDFGVNTCRCPASMGWVSYLVYESNQFPNLAFLVGHDFNSGTPSIKQLPSSVEKSSFLDNPEDWDVTAPIYLERYQPLFLPLPLAYGYEMSETDFNTFLADPDKDSWQGFTLRLRPAIKSGTVATPKEAKALENPNSTAEAKEKAIKEQEEASEIAKNLFGEEATRYLYPKDCGKVKKADGSYLSEDEILAKLPRLKSFDLKLHMVRRDNRLPYSVYQFIVDKPVLLLPSGESMKELKLEHALPPALTENN